MRRLILLAVGIALGALSLFVSNLVLQPNRPTPAAVVRRLPVVGGLIGAAGGAPTEVGGAPSVSLDRMSHASSDLSSWISYTNPDWGLSLQYPGNWKLVEGPGRPTSWIAFYPPDSNPDAPSSNITFALQPDSPYPPALPKNVTVIGIPSNESEVASGKLGSAGSYTLLLPYRSGTLNVSVAEDLKLKSFLRVMLDTLTLTP